MTKFPNIQSQSRAAAMWVRALKEAGVAFFAAAVILVVFYFFTFRWVHPEFAPFMGRDASLLRMSGSDFVPISLGGYRIEDDSAIIEKFHHDEAILALPRTFDAEDYPFIQLNLQGLTRFSRLKLLWRRAGDTSVTYALPMTRNGDGVAQIAMVYGDENYRGKIADIALLFYDGPAIGFEKNANEEIKIESIELKPFSAANLANQIFYDWITPPEWGGSANNIVANSHYHRVISLSAVVFFLAATSGILATLIRASITGPHQTPHLAVVLCLCMYSAVLLDANRWVWRFNQLIDTYERYQGRPLSEKIENNSLRCARYPKDCRADLLPYY